MSYAFVQNETIEKDGRIPTAARNAEGDWVLFGPHATDDDYARTGWVPITDTPRPDDTDTTTADRAIELVKGVPTVVWTERPLTDDELAARNRVDPTVALAALLVDKGTISREEAAVAVKVAPSKLDQAATVDAVPR